MRGGHVSGRPRRKASTEDARALSKAKRGGTSAQRKALQGKGKKVASAGRRKSLGSANISDSSGAEDHDDEADEDWA